MDDPIIGLSVPEVLADPYPAYSWLRQHRPMFWYERLDSWVMTRYDDCVAVLRDNDRFSADWRRIGEVIPDRAVSVQTLDPPIQTEVRRLVAEAARSSYDDDALERLVRSHAERLLQHLKGRESFDVVTEYAEPLALSTIVEYLGAPGVDPSWFIPVANAISAGMDAGLWPDRVAELTAAGDEFAKRAGGWLDHPDATGIVRAVADRLSDSDVDGLIASNTLRVFLHAGYTSASKLLSLAFIALFDGPGLAAWNDADQALAVAELMRCTAPVQAVARACVADTLVGGIQISAGQAVTLVLGAANHDPGQFTDADSLILDRRPNPHLGFGRGVHSCLGSRFATIQTRVAIESFARLMPRSSPVARPAFRRNLTLRSPSRFPVAPG